MSKTLDDLQAYHDRKKDRRDDHIRNMHLYMDMGEPGLAQANLELKRATALAEVMDTIEHCMLLVRRNETPKIVEVPVPENLDGLCHAYKEHGLDCLQPKGHEGNHGDN